MNHSLPRAIIETIVRKTITDIQDAPKRSTRNLVDMALTVAEGRFQNYFFQTAQTMLKNENSSYYRLVPDIVSSVDTEKIVAFGLNLGYNSCTVGAKKIRELEKKEKFNIPWSVTLAISGREYENRAEDYRSILEQGKALGIYTWILYALDGVEAIFSLVEQQPECAFVVCCNPEDITDGLMDEAEHIENMMLAVHAIDGVEEACHRLRSRKFLYSILYTYRDADRDAIIQGEYLPDIEYLHPAFTAFLAEEDCSEQTRKEVYRSIVEGRNSQQYATVLWDVVNDSRFIDGIISEDSCSAGFDPQGYLCIFQGRLKRLEYNVFQQPLASILKKAFPKEGSPQALA